MVKDVTPCKEPLQAGLEVELYSLVDTHRTTYYRLSHTGKVLKAENNTAIADVIDGVGNRTRKVLVTKGGEWYWNLENPDYWSTISSPINRPVVLKKITNWQNLLGL